MPDCQPLCGLLYNPQKIEIPKVVAPQYDVVSAEEVRFYKNLSPYNAFHLELPSAKEKARQLLEAWKRQGILLRDPQPTVYYYELEFKFSGKALKRGGFILLVKLSPFEEELVLPHERTFSFVKEERLNLLKVTQCYFSQIFGLYEDPGLKTLRLPPEKSLIFEVNFKEARHALFRITNQDFIRELLKHLKDKRIYIADGHHRYQTALAYKQFMEERFRDHAPLDFQYAPFYLTPLEEEGLLMLPTHRHYLFPLSEETKGRLRLYAEAIGGFTSKEVEEITEVFSEDRSIFLLIQAGQGVIFRIKGEIMAEIAQRDPVLSKFPLFNFLSIFERILGFSEESLKAEGKVEFFSNSPEKLKNLTEEGGFFVIFPRVSPKILQEVVSSGRLMPQKSTYFYPKILTGVLFYEAKGNPLPPNFKVSN